MAAERRPFLYIYAMHKPSTFNIVVLLLITLTTSFSFSQTSGESILEKFVKENEKISSIDCSLEQIIYENNTIEKFKGRYRADRKGRFRIDYREPSVQTVLSTEKNLLWYMPDSEVLYVIKNDLHNPTKNSLLHQPKFTGNIDKSLQRRYLGIWPAGFFTLAHHFVFLDTKNGIKLEMAISVNDLRLLEKRIRDRDGREIMKEMYGNYNQIGSQFFPRRVDVYAKTKTGYVRSISFYNDIQLNIPIGDEVFKMHIPKKTRVLTYGAQ